MSSEAVDNEKDTALNVHMDAVFVDGAAETGISGSAWGDCHFRT
jgi:hypothetical protein